MIDYEKFGQSNITHDRVSAVSCFNGDINKRFKNSVKSAQDRFNDPNVVDYYYNTNVSPSTQKANPREPGFRWPRAPREVDVLRNPSATKISQSYWLFDGPEQAYALLEQIIIDAENQAVKDAERPDFKCVIQVEVTCVSYTDFGPETTDFNKDVMNNAR